MSMTEAEVSAVFATDEKLQELEPKQSPDSLTPLESDPPDGGFEAWATVFGCFLIQFCGFGYILSFGVYQDFYTRIYMTDYPPGAISWIGGLATFLTDGISLISGPLYDRGWFYQLMIVGSLLQSLSLFALSFAKPNQFYLVFMVQGVLSGIGTSLTFAPSMAVISQHFSRRSTLAMSLAASGVPFGVIIHPIMLNHLLNGSMGFSRGILASAGFVSTLLLIACLSMRTRALPTPSGANYIAVAQKCSRDVLFILMAVGGTLFLIGLDFPVYYLQLDAVKHGVDTNFSFYALAIMNAASFVGRCTPGIITSYTGVLNLTIISSFACGALIISMIALSDITSVIVIGILYGYFSGIYNSVAVPLIVALTPDLSELGARMGICCAFTAIGGLLSGPISGFLLSPQYRWIVSSLFAGIISLVGSLIFAVLRLIIYRRGQTEWIK